MVFDPWPERDGALSVLHREVPLISPRQIAYLHLITDSAPPPPRRQQVLPPCYWRQKRASRMLVFGPHLFSLSSFSPFCKRITNSSSTKAVSFSSARTMKRFPSPCASAIQIVRPIESMADTP